MNITIKRVLFFLLLKIAALTGIGLFFLMVYGAGHIFNALFAPWETGVLHDMDSGFAVMAGILMIAIVGFLFVWAIQASWDYTKRKIK